MEVHAIMGSDTTRIGFALDGTRGSVSYEILLAWGNIYITSVNIAIANGADYYQTLAKRITSKFGD